MVEPGELVVRIKAEADVDEEVPPTRDTCFEVFRLDATLRWDAATKSPAVKSLVDNRDLIFEAQDTVWAEIGRQETSRELVNELLVASTNRGLGSDFLAWKRFCKLAKIPQFPITFPLIALCAVARCSMQTTAGYPKTFIGTLGRFKAATDTVWGKHAVLDAIDAICGDGKETLRVFMTERKPAVFSVYGIACRWSNTNGRPAQIRCGRYGDTTFDGDKCTFLLITDRNAKTKRWSLDAARSNSIHLHGPDARFIADPTWRPHLPDPIARAAIGTGEASSTALKRGSMDDALANAKRPKPAPAPQVQQAAPVPPTLALAPAAPPRNPASCPSHGVAGPPAAQVPGPARIPHLFSQHLSSFLFELDPSGTLDIPTPPTSSRMASIRSRRSCR